MLRLRTEEDAPEWVDLVDGAAALCKPPTTARMFRARARARAKLAQLVDGAAALTELGVGLDDMVPIATDSDREAVESTLFVLELAREAMIDWRNVLDTDGTVLAFRADLVPHFMSHGPAARAFLGNYLHPLNQVEAEGNA